MNGSMDQADQSAGWLWTPANGTLPELPQTWADFCTAVAIVAVVGVLFLKFAA